MSDPIFVSLIFLNIFEEEMYSHKSERRRMTRRPFLHMVVLFGSDPRVINYAKSIMQQFLEAGIDTWLQSTIYTTNSSRRLIDIKPEHLVSVITSSHADHLAVIGDRNMKNNTCQGRHDGKLVELTIEDQIRKVLVDWSKITSVELKALKQVPSNKNPYDDTSSSKNAHFNDGEINAAHSIADRNELEDKQSGNVVSQVQDDNMDVAGSENVTMDDEEILQPTAAW